jgi:hypoxanthine phosphoribosyltransferase
MNEMITASTSLLPLLTVSKENPLYYNIATSLFSIIACFNHVLPENFNGLTHVVKMLFSNVLFASLGNIRPTIGFIISILDLSPILLKNSKMKQVGESILQLPRLFIEIFLIYSKIYLYADINSNFLFHELVIIMICKIVYYFERKSRIKKAIRNDFSSWHAAEHLGLYLLFKNISGVKFGFMNLLIIFFSYVLIICLFFFCFNVYLHRNMLNRAPHWVIENPELKMILNNKLLKNKNSRKLQHYVMKPWASHLKLEFVSWKSLESICDKIIMNSNINPLNFDLVVGITTGGSFVGTYVAMKLNLPYVSIQSKLWSDISFLQNFYQACQLAIGRVQVPKVGEIPNVLNKRILLVDDTTYSGITMNGIRNILLEKGQAKVVETLVMWMKGSYTPNYFYSNKRIPIIWEWGVELD